jgi:hypothetical protein
LQLITQRENNTKDRINSSSNTTGVSKCSSGPNWESKIMINNKSIYLGMFGTINEASNAYQKALYNFNNDIPIEIIHQQYTSEYKGVSWYKKNQKWIVSITIDGKKKHLGSFTDELEARDTYCDYELIHRV